MLLGLPQATSSKLPQWQTTCDVLKPVRSTYPTHPLSGGLEAPSFTPPELRGGGSCWTTRVPPLIKCTLEWTERSKTVSPWPPSIGSWKILSRELKLFSCYNYYQSRHNNV